MNKFSEKDWKLFQKKDFGLAGSLYGEIKQGIYSVIK